MRLSGNTLEKNYWKENIQKSSRRLVHTVCWSVKADWESKNLLRPIQGLISGFWRDWRIKLKCSEMCVCVWYKEYVCIFKVNQYWFGIAAVAESIAVRTWRKLSRIASKWLYFWRFLFLWRKGGLRNYVDAEWWWSKEQFIPATLTGIHVTMWKTMEITLKHLNAFIGLFK